MSVPQRGILSRRAPTVAAALVELHAAAVALIDRRLAAGASVREASRVLGIGSHLAWKLLAFRRASDVDAMAEAIPGRRGWRTILNALDGDAETLPLLESTRAALTTFDRLAEKRGIDLAALLGPRPSHDSETAGVPGTVDKSRSEEYLIHRRMWPICGHAKIVAWLVAPDPHRPELGAAASLMLFHGIERTVPGPPLEIARPIMDEAEVRRRVPEDVEVASLFGRRGPLPPLIEELSSPGVVGREVQAIDPDTRTLGFTGVDAGRTTPLTLAFGQYMPAMGPLQGGPEDRVTFALSTMGAIEVGILDLLWPRDLPAGGPWEVRPAALTLDPGLDYDWWESLESPEMPSALESIVPDEASLPESLREISPTYRAGLRSAAEALGRRLDDFEVHRSIIRHPSSRMNVFASRLLRQEA